MANKMVEWVADHLPPGDFIDLYFVLSELVDVNLTDREICERASLDSLATATLDERSGQSDVPIGKQVF